jgi:hypothetical protein
VLIVHDNLPLATLADESARVLGCSKVLEPGEPPPIDGDVPPLSALARQVVVVASDLDREIRRRSDGSVDLGMLATLGMIAVGALDVALSGKLDRPPWFNLAWWGFRTFTTLEQDEIAVETKH